MVAVEEAAHILTPLAELIHVWALAELELIVAPIMRKAALEAVTIILMVQTQLKHVVMAAKVLAIGI